MNIRLIITMNINMKMDMNMNNEHAHEHKQLEPNLINRKNQLNQVDLVELLFFCG